MHLIWKGLQANQAFNIKFAHSILYYTFIYTHIQAARIVYVRKYLSANERVWKKGKESIWIQEADVEREAEKWQERRENENENRTIW